MGNSLELYRAAIGLHNVLATSAKSIYFERHITERLKLDTIYLLYIIMSITCCSINVDQAKLLPILLLLCGDVHPNPGPTNWADVCHEHVSLVTVNCRSLLPDIDSVRTELTNFSVIACTETWLNDTIPDSDISIPGFSDPYRRDRQRDSYGGVCIYVSENFYSKRRQDLENNNYEIIWIEIHTNKHKIFVCCAYRPQRTDEHFWQLLKNSCEDLIELEPTSIIILTGDLNDDYLDPNKCNLRNLERQLSFNQIISEPTRVTHTSQTLLDPILVNTVTFIHQHGVCAPLISDHSCPFICLKLSDSKNSSYKRKVWLFNRANWPGYRYALRTSFNNFNFTEQNVDVMVNVITTAIKNAASRFIPNRTVTIKSNDKKWMDNSIRINMRSRDRLYRLAKNYSSPANISAFHKQRNHVTNLIRAAKRTYDRSLSDQLKNGQPSSRLWWKLINHFVGNNTKASIPPLKDGTSLINDNRAKANFLNDYFTGITRVDDTNARLPIVELPVDNLLSNCEITVEAVMTIIQYLDISKAYGPDDLNPRLIREATDVISPILCHVFNHSLAQAKFPMQWKTANVVPIYKNKGDKYLVSNYRPISLLCCFSKIFEKLIFKTLYNHVKDRISSDQSGFLPGNSTVTQLVDIVHHIQESLDTQNEFITIFFDIAKAFDRVWHRGLIFKLRTFGVAGNLLDWFEDYLTNRKQRVTIAGTHSEWRNVEAGVPQGSTLGPLLFLVYINDLSTVTTHPIRLFADDTCLFKSSRNLGNDIITK